VPDRTEEWVRKLNTLAREMDETAQSLHPSAWPEALGPMNDRYRRLAANGPKEDPRA
jgi:hypothetical protein